VLCHLRASDHEASLFRSRRAKAGRATQAKPVLAPKTIKTVAGCVFIIPDFFDGTWCEAGLKGGYHTSQIVAAARTVPLQIGLLYRDFRIELRFPKRAFSPGGARRIPSTVHLSFESEYQWESSPFSVSAKCRYFDNGEM
jgi:hypothetical protein